MKIGIIGGAGGMGKGFAIRWCKDHKILIGSREAARAKDAAKEYLELVKPYGIDANITGDDNISVAKDSDVLVLSIPYESIDTVCPEILQNTSDNCIIVSPIVPMTKTEIGFEFVPLKDGVPSAYELVSKHVNSEKLVSAFHVISEKKLANIELVLDYDIFVCGDSADAVEKISGLINEIDGLRPIKLGPGKLSYMAEISTPILLNAMIRNKLKNPGIKIV